MSGNPLVSVIMTNYNKGDYVRSAIESILSQTFSDFELIIVDDGSSDKSTSIILQYQENDNRIIFIPRQHSGASSARNVGIESARGKLIAFMDSDDTCSQDKLMKQVKLFDSRDTFISYTNGWIIDQQGKSTGAIFNRDLERIPEDGSDGYIFKRLLRRNYIIDSSVMMPKQILEVEKFDERLSIGYDTDLYVRLARTFQFRYIPEPLYGYRIYEGNTWSKKNQVKILQNHIVMYQKWLRIFRDIGSNDRKVIVKYMWNSYAKLGDRKGMLKFAITDRMAFSFFFSKVRSALFYRLQIYPKKSR